MGLRPTEGNENAGDCDSVDLSEERKRSIPLWIR